MVSSTKSKKLETLTGKVGKVIFKNVTNEFKIFVLERTLEKSIIVSGSLPELIEGTELEVHGTHKFHEKYGKQFSAASYNFTYSKDSRSICLFLQSIAKWLGPIRAKALAETFGEDIEDIIENHEERLLEVPGIGKSVATSLIEAWVQNKDMKDIKIFLMGLGLSEKRIRRILHRYGIESQKVLTENPWLLIYESFAFNACDSIAQKLSLPATSPLRFQYFILYQLKECLSSGHLYLNEPDILEAFNQYNLTSTFPFNKIGVGLSDIKPHLEEILKEGFAIKEEDRYYEIQSFFYENESAKLLTKLIKTPDTCKFDKIDIEGYIKEYESSERITLSPDQSDAIRYFMTEKALVVTGAPGTGKTTVLKAFVRIMLQSGLSFELLCPTGIATKKLEKTVGNEAYTIHRRLGYNGHEWAFNNENKYETQVIVVDETSMVDMEVFYRLISAITSKTKLVFVGDINQLPSVGAGNVLQELIQSKIIKTVILAKIHRQEETSDIIKVANQIKDGNTDLSLFKNDAKADIFFIENRKVEKIKEMIIDLALLLKKKAITAEDGKNRHFQIISPRNSGPLSVEDLNQALQDKLNPLEDKKEINLDEGTLRVGDRVIIKKNNYDLSVYNGDIGKVVHITPQHVVIELEVFEGSGIKIDVPIEIVGDLLKLAYVITAHRCVSKDSLIFSKCGLVPASDMHKDDILYTGVSENKEKIIDKFETKPLKEVTLHTKYGYSLKTSKDHPILIGDGEGTRFKEMQDILVTDKVCIFRKVIPGKEVKITFKNTLTTKSRVSSRQYPRTQVNLPTTLTEDLSWMLGALLGDGCYTDLDDGTVEFTDPIDLDLLEEMRRVWKDLGLNVGEHKKHGKLNSVYVVSKNFRDWLLGIGLRYEKAPTKTVPEMFFSASVECRSAFIRGLFDIDGGADKNRPSCRFSSTSEKLAEGIQQILLSLGVLSSKSREKLGCYKLLICGIDVILFKERIGFFSCRKTAILENSLKDKVVKTTNTDIIPFGHTLALKVLSCFKEQVRSRGIKGKGLHSDRKIGGCLRQVIAKKANMSYFLLQRIVRVAKENKVVLPEIFYEVLSNNYFFDSIKEKVETDLSSPLIDFEVENQHSFVANGFVCHNSQGLEYPYVILPFVKQHGRNMLQRNLLYTAITRAKTKVILLGHREAIVTAILNDTIKKRNTIFGKRLNLWMENSATTLQGYFSKPEDCRNSHRLFPLLSAEKKS